MADAGSSSKVQSPARLLVVSLRIAAWTAVAPLVAFLALLGMLFLHFSPLPWPALGTALAVAFGVIVIASFIFLRPRVKAMGAFAVLFGGVWLWYTLIPPSNDRQWQPDLARTADR